MKKRDIVILHDFLESSMELLEILRKYGYSTRFVSFRRDEKSLRNFHRPILFAQIEGDSSMTQQRVTDLVQMKIMLQLPIVVLGPGVDQFAAILAHFFKWSVTVATPFSETDILNAIQQIDDLQELSGENSPDKEVTQKFTDIFASGHHYLGIQDKDLGGREYMAATDPGQIADKSYLPDNDEVTNVLGDVLSNADRWDIAHIHRTAFAANNMIEVLDISPEKKEAAKIAALLFGWAMTDDQRLTRTELTSTSVEDIREQLCAKLEESANRIAEQLNQPEAAEIVAAMANMVAGEPIDTTDETALLAASIFAADFMDRTCWQSGTWNPASAHRVLNRCKLGKVGGIPPEIMCCMLKIVLEGIEATLPKRMLPRSISQNAALLEMAKSSEKGQIKANERLISLAALVPGMRLKRPLVAFDGKTIIPEDVVLDADIIWRIWSLSAVRALNTPLVVQID